MDTKIGFGMVNAIELIKSFLVDEGRWMMVCDRIKYSAIELNTVRSN
ncbi:hypothetical protein IQ270_29675 [Microcoleus sp. LEGE 07076]|nr:hypothetical protein [Microcoleus sp. LEGE 07076]MBE9188687.1 hypothetical protein [Microcoleus sp. LEGE 07076]